MRYLLDTHILLWILENDSRLSPTVRQLVTDRANTLLVSSASLFEIGIKTKIGRLNTQRTATEIVGEMTDVLAIQLLPIVPAHIDAYQLVPLHEDHRDPFDRLLLAVAMYEEVVLISADDKFERYVDLVSVVR